MANDPKLENRAAYLKYLQRDPAVTRDGGDASIRILTDESDIEAAQSAARLAWSKMGYQGSDYRVGILSHDPFLMHLRDAVRFPDGSLGLHNRMMEGTAVAAIPSIDNKIALIRIFRHGLRNWSWEFPRGGVGQGEGSDAAIRRELIEEIGAPVESLIDLGPFTPGGSILATWARLYWAQIKTIGRPAVGEGIAEYRLCSVDEVGAMIANGDITDGFSIALYARAMLKGLIPLGGT